MSWSEIPMELFCEISKRLDLVDVLRAEKVCIWWRSMWCRKYARKSQIPWIMLPWISTGDDKQIQSRFFYSLTENKIYELYLPEIAGQVCIGSPHGYLFFINCEAELTSSNPLVKGAYLPLPSTSTFPGMVAVIRDSSSGQITEFEYKIGGSIRTSTSSYLLNFYHKKAILSPVADTIAVIYGHYIYTKFTRVGNLAFARVGDQSWTALEVPKAPPYLNDRSRRRRRLPRGLHPPDSFANLRSYVVDIIFHKGYLHALYLSGALAIFDLDHSVESPLMALEGSSNGKMDAFSVGTRYLVESPCGDKLFLVCRYLDYINGSEFPRTNNFEIYILDEATYTWNPIENLGDVSLFLGFNYSMSYCTRQYPNIKGNCIYFIDDYKLDEDHKLDEYYYDTYADGLKTGGDMGVFHLDDKTIGSLYPGSNLNRLIWPPPIFFTPILQ